MKMVARFSRVLTLIILLQSQLAWAQNYFLNENYNLDNNQVPPGWTLVNASADGCCGGLQGGRLWARVVDANYILRRAGSMPAGVTSVVLQWEGNVAYSYWGHVTGVQIQSGSHIVQINTAVSQYQYGDGYHVRAFDPRQWNWRDPSTALYDVSYPRIYGNYRYTVTLTQGNINFRGVYMADGSVRFDVNISDPSLSISQINTIEFSAYATTDNDCWVDNISVTLIGSGQPSYDNTIGLLVGNVASLDVEEQAARDFAISHGFAVTLIDPAIILANPSILDNVDGFWAANNTAPSGFNQATVSNALRARLENGKRLLVSWYGLYLLQYMGVTTVRNPTPWYPAVQDRAYWVDKRANHPIFEGLPAWVPPIEPDNPSQLLRYNTSGYAPGSPQVYWNSVPNIPYAFLWTSYGWPYQNFNSNIQAEYGITGRGDRAVHVANYAECAVGTGSALIFCGHSLTGGDRTYLGPIGFQILENALHYVCSENGQSPGPTPTILTLYAPVNQCRTGDFVEFTATLTDINGNPLAGKPIQFSWSYTGLEPAANFTGSWVDTTDLLGQCSLHWFSKWAAFEATVLSAINATFSGDYMYSSSSDEKAITVFPIIAIIRGRVYKDLNGNGRFDCVSDQPIPGTGFRFSSTYNNYTYPSYPGVETTGLDGSLAVDIPMCGYELSLVDENITRSIEIWDYQMGEDNYAHLNVEVGVVPPRGGFCGFVILDNDPNRRLSGVDVLLYDNYGPIQSTVSDANGFYEFRNVISDQPYFIYASKFVGNGAGQVLVKARRPALVEPGVILQVDLNLAVRAILDAQRCIEGIHPMASCIADITSELLGYLGPLGEIAGCIIPVSDDLCRIAVTSHGWNGTPAEKGEFAGSLATLLCDLGHCAIELVTGTGSNFIKLLEAQKFWFELRDKLNMLFDCVTGILEIVNWQEIDGALASALANTGDGGPYIAMTSSPVTLTISDSHGGNLRIENGQMVSTFAGGAWLTRTESGHEFAFVPDPVGNITARVSCLGQAGYVDTFGLSVLYPLANATYKVVRFENVVAPAGAIAQIEVGPTTTNERLLIDQNADGQFDQSVIPRSNAIYDVHGPLYAQVGGAVLTQNGTPILGVPLDIYDADGNLWQSTVTDSSGYYHIDSIPNGNYSISITEPLGFRADSTLKHFTINHMPMRIDFTLTKYADVVSTLIQPSTWLTSWAADTRGTLRAVIYGLPQGYTPANIVGSSVRLNGTVPCVGNRLQLQNSFPGVSGPVGIASFMRQAALLSLGQSPAPGQYRCTVSGDFNDGKKFVAECMITLDGSSPKQGNEQTVEEIPESFTLSQNYPNPFNTQTTIEYGLPEAAHVSIDIYDVLGKRIETLVNEYQEAGYHRAIWNSGRHSSGIYFYKINAGEIVEVRKMILIK